MSFPRVEEFEEFYCTVLGGAKKKDNARNIYNKCISGFSSPEELINCDINNSKKVSSVIVFIALHTGLKIDRNIQGLRIYKSRQIIDYFGLANNEFWEAYKTEVKGSSKRLCGFLVQVIKTLIYLQKRNVMEIKYKDLYELYSDNFFSSSSKAISFPTMLERVLNKIYKRAMPYRVSSRRSRELNCGQVSDSIKLNINKYIEDNYIQKGYDTKSPLYAIRNFFKWIKDREFSIKSINDLNQNHIDMYVEFLKNKDCKPRTKQLLFDQLTFFLEWLEENNITKNTIVEYGNRWMEPVDTKPRMFICREHFKKVLVELRYFHPENEIEKLTKEYLLVIAATGLRAKEALWLGPGCLIETNENVGEIILQVKEKTRLKNKPTSVLPWGVQAIRRLEDRFKSRDSIKLYNKKTKAYFYSLFEHDDKLLGFDKIYKVYRQLIEKADLRDEYGNKTDYTNIKLHALRHQKFNDIYFVTNGSASSVKIDSGHKHIEMTKQYTKQEEKKRKLEALRLIEEGKIVGKGAEILKQLLASPYTHERYIQIVKKMNLASNINEELRKYAMKYLGFGYCASPTCKLERICEKCDFFYTCKTFAEELKERYSKNFILIKSRIHQSDDEVNIANEKQSIEELKYQEKWLKEIGVTEEEIYELRGKYCLEV